MLFITLAAAASASPVAPNLQSLGFLAGHCWTAPIVGRKGGVEARQTDTHCFEPMHGGKHLRDRHEVKDDTGKVIYGGETIYAWNGKTKRIEFAYYSADGAVSYGSMTPKDGTLDFGDETYDGPDGKEIRISTVWRPIGVTAFDAVSRSAFMPTGQRVARYTRID